MTSEELLNLGACGAASFIGTNTEKGCPDLLEAAQDLWLLSPSLKIAPDEEIDSDYIKSLQKAGQLVILKGVSTFQETGSDDATETLEDDTMLLANQGKYKYTATFAGKGLFFNKALSALRSHEGWKLAVVNKKGDVFLTHNPETGQTFGFKLGMVKNNKLQVATNTTSTKPGIDMQLLNRYELDDYYVRWDQANLGFDPRLVEPISQMFISLVNNPADTDTTITAKVLTDRGRKDVVTGILFSQFLNTVDGVTNNPTGGDDSVTEGTYVLTGMTALNSGEKGTFKAFDNSANSSVIEVAGDGLYKSNTVNYTVT